MRNLISPSDDGRLERSSDEGRFERSPESAWCKSSTGLDREDCTSSCMPKKYEEKHID